MKYAVTIVRYGFMCVEAASEAEALDIADHQTTETVNWSDDWTPMEAEADDSLPSWVCVTEKSFE